MRYSELSELRPSLSRAFFATKAITVLTKEKQVEESDRIVLERIRNFVADILEGRDQVTSGYLKGPNAGYIDAYSRAVTALSSLEEGKEKEQFQVYMKKVESEINEALANKIISPKKLDKTIYLLSRIRSDALNENGRRLKKETDILDWNRRLL